MEELKTLKDLNLFQTDIQEVIGGVVTKLTPYPNEFKGKDVLQRLKLERTFVNVESLRQEAIKHIKDLRRESLDAYWKNIHEKSAIPKIMEIFDLTEEDLK